MSFYLYEFKSSRVSAILYYIALPFIYLLSLLPFPVLYLVSDGVYFLLYHVIGYRKEVVLTNLKNSFPNKTDEELKAIRKKFYKYLCDLFLETFKTLTISKQSMLKHCYFDEDSVKLFERLSAENKSIILVLGHQGNWEWAGNTFSLLLHHQLYVIYHPLKDQRFNNLIRKMRMTFGTKLIAMKDTYKDMLQNREELNATAFIADQTPSNLQGAHWTMFLNQDTPVFKGTEVIARKIGYPVVYSNVRRVKRGYYEMHVEMLVEDPKQTTDGEISERHTRRLEKDIMLQPETWLWSHRRWKHKRPADV
ncbi:MAG: lysophospholipid acyltransferase family protein [Flavipsychrobacter sp.]|nr:lysophospholipid acyltransferase family protein [Flavipsychrobacter sp.]